MADLDKGFEADEPIQQIAEDLNRIKRVAELLRKAQASVDTVLTASEEVISKAGDFAANSTKILQRLDDVDLDGRLTQLQSELSEARNAVGSTHRSTAAALEELSESQGAGVSEIRSQLNTLSLKQSEANAELTGRIDHLASDLEKLKRSLDASVQQLEKTQEAQAGRTVAMMETGRKQSKIAAGVALLVAIIIIVLILAT